jgi:hypothetical protein
LTRALANEKALIGRLHYILGVHLPARPVESASRQGHKWARVAGEHLAGRGILSRKRSMMSAKESFDTLHPQGRKNLADCAAPRGLTG